jgi:hypothetical protein
MMMEVFRHLLVLHLVRRLDDKGLRLVVVLHPVRQLGVNLVLLDALQILGVLLLDVNLPFLDVVHLVQDAHRDAMVAVLVVVALVDVERRQLRMDCYLHVVGEEGSLFRRLQQLVRQVLVRMEFRQQVLRNLGLLVLLLMMKMARMEVVRG